MSLVMKWGFLDYLGSKEGYSGYSYSISMLKMHQRLLPLLLLFFCPFLSHAQQDTLYVYFENTENTFYSDMGKHFKDPIKSTEFPFHGGTFYSYNYDDLPRENYINFSYYSYVPKGSDVRPDYIEVDSAYLESNHFHTEKYFRETPMSEIRKTFLQHNFDQVIMLLDPRQLKNDNYYLVRVYVGYHNYE